MIDPWYVAGEMRCRADIAAAKTPAGKWEAIIASMHRDEITNEQARALMDEPGLIADVRRS